MHKLILSFVAVLALALGGASLSSCGHSHNHEGHEHHDHDGHDNHDHDGHDNHDHDGHDHDGHDHDGHDHDHDGEVAYGCPMLCEAEKTYAEAGKCPVCKMDLKKVEDDHAGHDHGDHDGHNH